jgi:hypothetical protein
MKLHRSLAICATLAVAAIATPAAADYWIVRDGPGEQCVIVSQKPTNESTIVGRQGSLYSTREEAEDALSALCDED